MKKLTLLAALAIGAAIPAYAATPAKPANAPATPAATAPHHHHMHHHMKMVTTSTTTIPSPTANNVYTLTDGQKIEVRGSSVYMVNSSGAKFYAPTSAYTTRDGQTFYTESGQLMRVESRHKIYVDPAEIAR